MAPGVTGRGGTPIDLRHGKTSKDRLQVVWTHPVWQPKPVAADPTGQRTVAGVREHALPLAEAYALITGDDQRPLLILRECELCKGTDHALLSRDLDNEQTVLLSHWFHCVKLPPNVLDAQHPFYNLFAAEKDGEHVPHLFFCDADGSNRAALPGDQSQTELWATMFGFLERNYQGDAKKAVKELRTLLAQFDKVDNMEQDVKARMDREIDKRGVDTERVKKLELELADLKKQRQALLGREQKICGLARRELNAPKPTVGTATGR